MAAIRTGSAVRRRILGRRLRKLREQAGHTLESAAPLLEWSTSKLARIETAQQIVDVQTIGRGVHPGLSGKAGPG